MSAMALQLEIDTLWKARTYLFKELKDNDNKSLQETLQGLNTLRTISKQIDEKQALLEERGLRALDAWEKELLGM